MSKAAVWRKEALWRLDYRKRSRIVPALFLHIQKNAGSSIVEIVRSHYPPSYLTSHGDHVGHPAKRFAKIPFVSGHFGFEYASKLMGGRYSFVFLRDPVERICSLYHYFLTRDPNEYEINALARKYTFEEFLEKGLSHPLIRSRVFNNQVWQLAVGYANEEKRFFDSYPKDELLEMAKEHIKEFSYVGFAKTFDQDRDVILRALNMPIPEIDVRANVNPARPSIAELNTTEEELLEQLSQLDQALYDHAWRIRKRAK